MKKFFLTGVVKIKSNLGFERTAALVAGTMRIPNFTLDRSGRYEDQEMFLSNCFGLEFGFCQLKEDPPNEYEVSVMSDVDQVDYDGTEADVDATAYVLSLLNRAKELQVKPS